MSGRTPMQTFMDGKKYFAEKNLNDLVAGQILQTIQEKSWPLSTQV